VSPAADDAPSRLRRQLGLGDAVVVGLGAMLGAGVFAAFGPAAASAGSGLLVGLAIAAVVAYCNATSSARLAAVYPESGGTYVYGRELLGPFWGYVAGWGFVVGKTASGAAMALTAGANLGEERARAVAVAAVVALTVVNLLGIRKTAGVTRALVAVVLAVLAAVVIATFAGGEASVDNLGPITGGGWRGILESAGLLFFAFAGYARIATLGEEVVDPARTIPLAVPIALGITLVVYALVGTGALLAVGPDALAASSTPLATAVEAGSFDGLVPVVRLGGGVAALGVLLSVVLGTSRTAFAMAANGDLPRGLAVVHPDRGIPHRAVAAVGVAVTVLVLVADLRGAIGFSSFCVLAYYAVANASALRLGGLGRRDRATALAGLSGCCVVALTLPVASVAAGAVVLAAGALAWAARAVSRRTRRG
jgi:basic amino acid/polyamine antiporter, APA family